MFVSEPHFYKAFPYRSFLIFTLLLTLLAEVLPYLFPQSGASPLHAVLLPLGATDTYLSAASLGAFIIYGLTFKPSYREWISVIIVGLALEVWWHNHRLERLPAGLLNTWALVIRWGIGLGMAALGAIFYRALKTKDPQERTKAWATLTFAALLPWWEILTLPIRQLFSDIQLPLQGQVFDFALYYIDYLLGFMPNLYFANLVYNQYPALYPFFLIVYAWLALFMLLAAWQNFLAPSRSLCNPLLFFIFLGLVGTSCYNFVPAVGTNALLGSLFPAGPYPPPPSPETVIDAPAGLFRNAMPSLHMGWMIACLWAIAPYRSSMRTLLWIVTPLMFIATCSIGEHYLIDTVMAFPCLLLCYALATPWLKPTLPWKLTAIALGALTLFGPLYIIRFHPTLLTLGVVPVWGTALILIALSYLGKYQLDRVYLRVKAQAGSTSPAPSELEDSKVSELDSPSAGAPSP